MKVRQRLFLDRVVKLLVGDTIMNYEKETIHPQFIFSPIYLHTSRIDSICNFMYPYFKKYSINNFGLTDEEIEYVWDQYKSIIKDKISNKES